MGAKVSLPNDTRTQLPPPLPRVQRWPSNTRSRRKLWGKRVIVNRVVVVVLGDVGRSPRMQYHAASLASHDVRVELVGYEGERCIGAVEDSPQITCHRFNPPFSGSRARQFKRCAYVPFAMAKALALMVRLLYVLIFRVPAPGAILVQNPPSLPSLACVYLACLVRGCPMVLDWHNLGFTMFGRGPLHPLVLLTRLAEGFFGRRASLNLTVSLAMRNWVRKRLEFECGLVNVCSNDNAFSGRVSLLPIKNNLTATMVHQTVLLVE